MDLYHTKAPGETYSLIGVLDRGLVERAASEIGGPDSWPSNERDAHPKLNEGRSLVFREYNYRDTLFRHRYSSVEQIIVAVLGLGYGSTPAKIVAAYLAPGATIKPHRDSGEYYKYHNRIHIPLITAPEVTMFAGDEPYHMDLGNIYLFQNLRRHSVINGSQAGRIHLIVDVLDPRYNFRFYRRCQWVLDRNPLWIGGIYRLYCYALARWCGSIAPILQTN